MLALGIAQPFGEDGGSGGIVRKVGRISHNECHVAEFVVKIR